MTEPPTGRDRGGDRGGDRDPSILRRTLVGLAGGGLLFLALGVYMNAATGMAPADNVGPLLMLVVVGATVGGLVAPLAAGLLDRWRDRREG